MKHKEEEVVERASIHLRHILFNNRDVEIEKLVGILGDVFVFVVTNATTNAIIGHILSIARLMFTLIHIKANSESTRIVRYVSKLKEINFCLNKILEKCSDGGIKKQLCALVVSSTDIMRENQLSRELIHWTLGLNGIAETSSLQKRFWKYPLQGQLDAMFLILFKVFYFVFHH